MLRLPSLLLRRLFPAALALSLGKTEFQQHIRSPRELPPHQPRKRHHRRCSTTASTPSRQTSSSSLMLVLDTLRRLRESCSSRHRLRHLHGQNRTCCSLDAGIPQHPQRARTPKPYHRSSALLLPVSNRRSLIHFRAHASSINSQAANPLTPMAAPTFTMPHLCLKEAVLSLHPWMSVLPAMRSFSHAPIVVEVSYRLLSSATRKYANRFLKAKRNPQTPTRLQMAAQARTLHSSSKLLPTANLEADRLQVSCSRSATPMTDGMRPSNRRLQRARSPRHTMLMRHRRAAKNLSRMPTIVSLNRNQIILLLLAVRLLFQSTLQAMQWPMPTPGL